MDTKVIDGYIKELENKKAVEELSQELSKTYLQQYIKKFAIYNKKQLEDIFNLYLQQEKIKETEIPVMKKLDNMDLDPKVKENIQALMQEYKNYIIKIFSNCAFVCVKRRQAAYKTALNKINKGDFNHGKKAN